MKSPLYLNHLEFTIEEYDAAKTDPTLTCRDTVIQLASSITREQQFSLLWWFIIRSLMISYPTAIHTKTQLPAMETQPVFEYIAFSICDILHNNPWLTAVENFSFYMQDQYWHHALKESPGDKLYQMEVLCDGEWGTFFRNGLPLVNYNLDYAQRYANIIHDHDAINNAQPSPIRFAEYIRASEIDLDTILNRKLPAFPKD